MAQVPVPCELCDTVENVEYYCVTCAEVLCKLCKQTHLRSRKTKNDEIITLSEALKQNVKSSKVPPPLFYCSLHPAVEISLFCSKCEVFVCLECFEGKHQDHKQHVLTLTKFKNLNKEKLLSARKHLTDKKSHFEKAMDVEGKTHQNFSVCTDKCKKDILEQKTKIIKELDVLCDGHFAKLSLLQENEDGRFSKACAEVRLQINLVMSTLQSVQCGIDTEDPPTILQATRDVNEALKKLKECSPSYLSIPVFKPQEINKYGLSQQLGIVQQIIDKNNTDGRENSYNTAITNRPFEQFNKNNRNSQEKSDSTLSDISDDSDHPHNQTDKRASRISSSKLKKEKKREKKQKRSIVRDKSDKLLYADKSLYEYNSKTS